MTEREYDQLLAKLPQGQPDKAAEIVARLAVDLDLNENLIVEQMYNLYDSKDRDIVNPPSENGGEA